ncbi:MAG: hypothetical protein JW771_06215 [Candidatus Thermoplasmatota archaeon]|nr:hypothetical protein [Candidatus Thermoplasmatota archaeon]
MVNEKIKPYLQVGNLLIAFLTVIINILANALPLNGKYTGDIAGNIPNLFVPSGLTFAIWGVIYVLLILFALYQARDLFSAKKIEMPFLHRISFWFILAGIGNIIWIFLWHYEQVILSILPMLLLFVSLLAMYLRLEIGKIKVMLKEKLAVHTMVSVYLGWITVATIANVTAVLVTLGWDTMILDTQILLTLVILIVATIIGLLVLIQREDIGYTLVIIWALLGIAIKRMQSDSVFDLRTEVAYTALAGVIVLTILLISMIVWHQKKTQIAS